MKFHALIHNMGHDKFSPCQDNFSGEDKVDSKLRTAVFLIFVYMQELKY